MFRAGTYKIPCTYYTTYYLLEKYLKETKPARYFYLRFIYFNILIVTPKTLKNKIQFQQLLQFELLLSILYFKWVYIFYNIV